MFCVDCYIRSNMPHIHKEFVLLAADLEIGLSLLSRNHNTTAYCLSDNHVCLNKQTQQSAQIQPKLAGITNPELALATDQEASRLTTTFIALVVEEQYAFITSEHVSRPSGKLNKTYKQ